MKVNLNKWYLCDLDKERYVQLKEKSDWAGFQHVGLFFISLFFFGYLSYFFWGTWLGIIFLLIYGNNAIACIPNFLRTLTSFTILSMDILVIDGIDLIFSILLYKVSSTFLQSTNINLTSEGCFLYRIEHNITFKPNGRLEYGANFSPSSDATVSYVSDPSTDYTLSIAHEETHNIRAGLGFDFITENGLTIMANYERDQSDNSHSDTLYLGASYISNRETEYAMVLDNDKAFFDYKKNLNGFDIKVSSNYTLMSEIPDYGANLEVSSKF